MSKPGEKAKDAGAVKAKMDAFSEQGKPNAIAMAPQVDGTTIDPQTGGPRLESVDHRSKGVPDEQFPTDAFLRKDKDDLLKTEKLSLADAQGVTPFGKLIADDSDFAWVRKKREEAEEANFQQWFALNFDHMAPEEKAIARKLFPNFYAQRDKVLDEDIELQRKIAKIKLHGIQSKEDLLLKYALEAGYINMDRLHHILHPEQAEAQRTAAVRRSLYQRGLFNPKRTAHRQYGASGSSTGVAVRQANSDAYGFNPDNFTPNLGLVDASGAKMGFSFQHEPLGNPNKVRPETPAAGVSSLSSMI